MVVRMAALDSGAIDPSTVFRGADLSLVQVLRYAVPVNTTNPNGNRPDFDLSKLQEQVAEVCGLEMPDGKPSVKWDETLPVPCAALMEEFKEKGADALGLYDPRDSSITIFVERCREFAKATNLEPDDVILIVLIHELAHRVHHRGITTTEAPETWWKNFPSAARQDTKQLTPEEERKVVEQLAEQTTLILIVRNYPHLREAFEKM